MANGSKPVNKTSIAATLNAICMHHAPLQQGNEVLWALWIARSQGILLDPKAVAAICAVDDDLVALTALHLNSENLLPGLDTGLWSKYASADHLFSEHWLLAYESMQKGWLPALGGNDYTQADPVFNILRQHDVTFYEVAAVTPQVGHAYDEEESDDLLAELVSDAVES